MLPRAEAHGTNFILSRSYSFLGHLKVSNSSPSIFLLVWFPHSSFQQVRQPSIPNPVEEDTSKIWDTTGTVIIQGPSILLLVWRSIMFNGSFLRVCRILRFVKKTRCLGRVPKHRNQWPLNKDGSCCISYFWRIFHGARNRGLSDLLERWIRKPQPWNESSKYAQTESFGG